MKNIIRRINIISIILVTILALKVNVYAANDSYKTHLSVENSQVQRGDSITLNISLSDIAIESEEKGIGAYSAKLEFDSSILEYSNSAGTDIWEAPFYQEQLIIGNTNDGKVVNTNQSIGTITFKVKENAKLGETTIKLVNFSGSTAVVDVPAEDASIKITVTDNAGEGGSGSQDENGNGEGEGGNQGENGSGSEGENGNNGSQGGNETENGNLVENGNDGSQNGNDQNQNVNGVSQNGSGNTNGDKGGSNINDAQKDNVREGTLPQSGDMNITVFILMSLFTLVAISLLIRIKLISKKIKKNS